MNAKKFYSADDIEMAKAALEELPDLKPSRLTKTEALSALKTQIIALCDNKGYTVDDIRSALETVGIFVGVKAIRDILANRKQTGRRSQGGRSRAAVASENKGETPQAGGGQASGS